MTPNAVAENSPFHTIVGHISLQVPEVYGQLPLQSLQFSLVTTGVPFTVENTSTQAGLKLTGKHFIEHPDILPNETCIYCLFISVFLYLYGT